MGVDAIAKLGIVSARARSIVALADAEISGALSLETRGHQNPENIAQQLDDIPGIGPWTAHYIAMRALRWPDAFPHGDIAIEVTGIREGEKMYEELFYDPSLAQPTRHPKIMRAPKGNKAAVDVPASLAALRIAMESGDVDAVRKVLFDVIAS